MSQDRKQFPTASALESSAFKRQFRLSAMYMAVCGALLVGTHSTARADDYSTLSLTLTYLNGEVPENSPWIINTTPFDQFNFAINPDNGNGQTNVTLQGGLDTGDVELLYVSSNSVSGVLTFDWQSKGPASTVNSSINVQANATTGGDELNAPTIVFNIEENTLTWLSSGNVVNLFSGGGNGYDIHHNAGAGGSISFSQDKSSAFSITPQPLDSEGPYVPWRPGYAIVDVLSLGGVAVIDPDSSGGGGGGQISAQISNVDSPTSEWFKDTLPSGDTSNLAQYLFVSQGGTSAAFERNAVPNGAGGEVGVDIQSVSWQGVVPQNVSFYAVVAASVGGASDLSGSGDKLNVVPSGAGGTVFLNVIDSTIELSGPGQSIALVATSTGDVVVPNGQSLDSSISPSDFGEVFVQLQDSNISATQFGVIANSTPGWSTDPFTGEAIGTLASPGNGGGVTVSNNSSIAVSGTNAVGILMQSIGGSSASVLGAGLFVGDSAGSGGTGGSVAYGLDICCGMSGGSAKITAQGDGSAALQIQSIGGGGGNGGNADGLFVAVGGAGGDGGAGGAIDLTAFTNQTLSASGLHAKGVIGQSIGGGGGNGGFAKSFGQLIDMGIGGKAGSGGDGGQIDFVATNSAITTSGQHAYGLALQSIGGGGGTGGASNNADVGLGFTITVGVGGSGGDGGAGGEINVTLDDKSSITTTGLDAHGILLQSISGGGGAGGAASGTTYNVGDIPDVPLKLNFAATVGGLGGQGTTSDPITVTNSGTITTSGSGSYGLVAQSIGGGGGHGADSTAGTNSWGDSGTNPLISFNAAMALGGDGGASGDGGPVTVTNNGTISTSGHNAIGLLAHSIGGGGGTAGSGNAYNTNRWVGDNTSQGQETTVTISTALGAGGNGGSAGDGGAISVGITADKSAGFTTLGSGSSGIVAQSIGGGGGVAGDAGTQAINGGDVTAKMQLGGQGGAGGSGGEVDVLFAGTIQTGAVTQLQYTDSNGTKQLSSPVTIGGSSHGIVAQSIGGGGGMGGNADPTASLVPELTKDIASWSPTPKSLQKILNIKDGIVFWAKRVVEDDKDRPTFGISYTANMSLGGAGGVAGDGGNVTVQIPSASDVTTYGHHSYAIMAQSVGGGGGVAGTATGNSLVSGDISAGKLGSSLTFGMSLNAGGKGGASGDGGDVTVLITNPRNTSYDVPNNPNPGNYLRTGGYASHVVFAQSVGGGGGVGHEGSIIGVTAIPGAKTPNATLGNTSSGQISAGNGGTVTVGSSTEYVTGWIESAGDASSLIFAQSVGGGGGTLSLGCTTNGAAGNTIIRQSGCFTQADFTWDNPNNENTNTFSAAAFANEDFKFDMTLQSNGGIGGDVSVAVGDSHLTTAGDRAIAIVAQSIGGGGGYISAGAQNVGHIEQSSPSGANDSTGGDVEVNLKGGKGGSGTAYVSTYGDGAWGVLAQSIGGGGGFFGDPALDIVGLLTAKLTSGWPSMVAGGDVWVMLDDAIIKTEGTNAHAIVAQSWSNGGGVFSGSSQDQGAIVRMGTKLSGNASGENQIQYASGGVTVSLDSRSTVSATGNGAIAILAQGGSADISIDGSVTGGKTYTNTNPSANNRVVQGVGVMIAAGGAGSNTLTIGEGGVLTTVGGTKSGYAIMAGVGKTNVTNSGTVTGSVDLGSDPGTFTNESGGVLNKGAVYKVGNNSLHNYGTINIGDEDSVGTTNLEGRLVQYEGGRFMVTLDALGEQTSDRLIVDGTAVIGGTIHKRTKSLLPGNYEFLTATDLTVTAEAADRLLFAWDATVDSNSVTVTPTRTFRTEGLSLSPTSQNLVSYLERAWDNADRHHAELFGYKHELEAVEDYNTLLEALGGQALNAQPLQMRMAALSGLGDSLACPVITPVGLRLEQDNCVWARLTGDLTELSSNSQNLGFRASGGGLRIGMQHGLTDGWTVGAALGYNLNYLTSTNFTSNGQFFDLSLSAKRDVGQWTVGGALGYAQGWFSNNRRLSMPGAGISSGFNEQYTSRSQLSIYGAKFRAAYTFEQESHYIRPYVDLDVAYSRAPGYSESGPGKLALKMNSVSQWNVGITPMLEFGTDVQADDGTRFKVFVSAGATFLPNNKQTSAASFVGASDLNGTFDVVNGGPDVLGRLNFGAQIYAKEGYEVRAQYGLQAGQNYWSQNLSINFTYRF